MPLNRRIALLSAVLLSLPAAAMAEGMPQLDFKNPLTTSQVVWGVIIFVVLYILASKFALPQVASVLEERAGHIARDLESARNAKTRADTDLVEATAAIATARAEAQAAVASALDEAKQAVAVQAVALNDRLDTQLRNAEQQIAGARASAMAAMRQVATETAITVVTRLTGVAPEAERLNNAVGAALAARGVG